jgi:hypothetical protein
MSTDANRRRHYVAMLQWEAACERLRASIKLHATLSAPFGTNVAEAIAIARRTLDDLERAYGAGFSGNSD